MRAFLLFILFTSSALCDQTTFDLKRMSKTKDKVVLFSPPPVNSDFFQLELGFKGDKELFRIPFHSFASAFISERTIPFGKTLVGTNNPSYSNSPDKNIKAASLGFKAGLIIPTNPWINLYLITSLGIGKTVLHQSPWLGKNDSTVSDNRVYFWEVGGIYQISNYMLTGRMHYSTIKYLSKKFIFSLGYAF